MDSPILGELRDTLDGIGFRAVDRFHRMREDAEVIGGSDADAGVTMIDAKRGMREVGFLGSHQGEQTLNSRKWNGDENPYH